MENMTPNKKFGRNNAALIPKDVLNDLSSRFVINAPEEERDLKRICFQIELAHWFYIDFYREEDTSLPSCSLKEFIHIIFNHIPFLQTYVSQVDTIIDQWITYKKAVPTYGAILLDKELKNVLLVQGFLPRASWGFPKGKVNKLEQPHDCAIREVYEETGFDISDLINENEYIEYTLNEQLIRLYVITGVPTDIKFEPKTRREIKSIEWFPISQLPSSKKDTISKSLIGTNTFLLNPFVKQLKKWIASRNIIENEKTDHDKEQQLKKQQQLFAQLSMNELSKYMNMKEGNDMRPTRPSKSTYTLPPRMMKQRNFKQGLENDRSPNYHYFLDNDGKKLMPHSRIYKRALDSIKPEKVKTDIKSVFNSLTWENFTLDTEALIVCFNINMRKPLLK